MTNRFPSIAPMPFGKFHLNSNLLATVSHSFSVFGVFRNTGARTLYRARVAFETNEEIV